MSGIRTAVLGPEGTNSVYAAEQYDAEADLVLARTNAEVITMVARAEVTRGIVALENSIEGTVRQAYDGIFQHGLTVYDELEIPIQHALWGVLPSHSSGQIKEILSHEQALGQTAGYLDAHYPDAERIAVGSTAAAMALIAETRRVDALAIGPAFAGEQLGLTAYDANVGDEPNNTTQFVVFSKQPPSGTRLDFTMVALVPSADHPGLLHAMTGVLAEPGIDISRFEARPTRNQLGEYVFYARLAMPTGDERYQQISENMGQLGVEMFRMSA